MELTIKIIIIVAIIIIINLEKEFKILQHVKDKFSFYFEFLNILNLFLSAESTQIDYSFIAKRFYHGKQSVQKLKVKSDLHKSE